MEVLAEYNEGDLDVGDDVMVVLVAGDIRENVFPALDDAVNELKSKAAIKEEQIPRSKSSWAWSIFRRRRDTAHAETAGFIKLEPRTLQAIVEGAVKKGDPFAFAEAAGMLAVKRTPDLIPHCHPIPIERVEFNFEVEDLGVAVSLHGEGFSPHRRGNGSPLGVTMALNTIWDIVKYLEKDEHGQYPDTA